MRYVISLAAALLAAPASGQNIPSVTLSPGEAVTVRIDDAGNASAPTRSRAEWTPLALYAARQLAGAEPPDAPVPVATEFHGGPGTPPPEPPVSGQLRIRFFAIAGQHTLLVIDNGLGRPLAYRARITVRDRTQPTDVCVLLSNAPGFEHWSYLIDSIALSDFRYSSWTPGQPVPCA